MKRLLFVLLLLSLPTSVIAQSPCHDRMTFIRTQLTSIADDTKALGHIVSTTKRNALAEKQTAVIANIADFVTAGCILPANYQWIALPVLPPKK